MEHEKKIELLRTLEKEKIVHEICPEPHYWRFEVLDVDRLPEELLNEYRQLGEIRW